MLLVAMVHALLPQAWHLAAWNPLISAPFKPKMQVIIFVLCKCESFHTGLM